MATRGSLSALAFQALRALRERARTQVRLRAMLKEELASALGLSERDLVQISEVACPDPDCADMQTVVLLMRAGEPTRIVRLTKPVTAVTPGDCLRALEEERHRREGPC